MKKKNGKNGITIWKVPTPPDQKALTKEVTPLIQRCAEFKIVSEDHFTASWILVQNIDNALVRIGEMFDPFVSGLFNLHKMALTMRRAFTEPLALAKEHLMAERDVFRQAQERIKRQAEAKLAEGLRKEQQKEIEKARREAVRRGDTELVAVLEEAKAAVPLPTINSAPAVPKQEGSVIRERWIYEITDADLVQREFCSPDPKKIRPVVEALGPMCKIKGIAITRDVREHSRSTNGDS